MGPYAAESFQMLRMHQQADKIIAIHLQAEQHTDSHIVNPALHRPVHGLCMIGIVMFRPGRMKDSVIFFIVCLLEQNISTNPRIPEFPVILHRSRRNIDIHSSDGTVLMMDTVYRLDTFQNVFNGIVDRVFPRFYCQPFMSHILQGDHFLPDFLLGQLFSPDMSVLSVIGAVCTAIDTIIGQI